MWVLGAQDAAADFECFLLELVRFRQFPLCPQRTSQVMHRDERIRVLRATPCFGWLLHRNRVIHTLAVLTVCRPLLEGHMTFPKIIIVAFGEQTKRQHIRGFNGVGGATNPAGMV